jgi:hypothetical protein
MMSYSELHQLALARGYDSDVLSGADRTTLVALLSEDLHYERTGEPPPALPLTEPEADIGVVIVGVVTALAIPIVGLLIGLVLVGKDRRASGIIVLSIVGFLVWAVAISG